MIIFCFLNNILYKTDYDKDGNYKYIESVNLIKEKNDLTEELKKYNKNDINDSSMFVTIKTKLDIINLKQNYKTTSWQYNKINTYLYDIIYSLNYNIYIEKNLDKYNEINEEYQNILTNLNNNNWLYFLKKEKTIIEDNINNLKNNQIKITNKKELLEIEENIKKYEFDLKIINYRIKNNILEDNSYLNQALENYKESNKIINYYKNNLDNLNHQDKLSYQQAISNLEINKYIIKNKQNINKENNLNYQLRTIVEDYEIFLVILILIITGITICDEFKDGTIKLLLIKPYSRGKILLSKFLSIILIMLISILGLILIQTILGSLIFGLDSLNLPVVVYDINKAKLVEYQVAEYMLIRIITKIPFFLSLISISMLIGVISNNSVLSLIIPLILYILEPTIESLAITYNLTFMKYLINLNWSLEDYLFGNLKKASFLNLNLSIKILALYFTITILFTFKIFKKKNIKNI